MSCISVIKSKGRDSVLKEKSLFDLVSVNSLESLIWGPYVERIQKRRGAKKCFKKLIEQWLCISDNRKMNGGMRNPKEELIEFGAQ